MRHSTQGKALSLNFRVETPFTNGNLDHLFEDKAKALIYCYKAAKEFGMAIMFDHLTDEVMNVTYHLEQMAKNTKTFDLRGNLKFARPVTNFIIDVEPHHLVTNNRIFGFTEQGENQVVKILEASNQRVEAEVNK